MKQKYLVLLTTITILSISLIVVETPQASSSGSNFSVDLAYESNWVLQNNENGQMHCYIKYQNLSNTTQTLHSIQGNIAMMKLGHPDNAWAESLSRVYITPHPYSNNSTGSCVTPYGVPVTWSYIATHLNNNVASQSIQKLVNDDQNNMVVSNTEIDLPIPPRYYIIDITDMADSYNMTGTINTELQALAYIS